jgi:hypothetical protein
MNLDETSTENRHARQRRRKRILYFTISTLATLLLALFTYQSSTMTRRLLSPQPLSTSTGTGPNPEPDPMSQVAPDTAPLEDAASPSNIPIEPPPDSAPVPFESTEIPQMPSEQNAPNSDGKPKKRSRPATTIIDRPTTESHLPEPSPALLPTTPSRTAPVDSEERRRAPDWQEGIVVRPHRVPVSAPILVGGLSGLEAPSESVLSLLAGKAVTIDIYVTRQGRARLIAATFIPDIPTSPKSFMIERLRESVTRAHWKPAIDGNGEPVGAPLKINISWTR